MLLRVERVAFGFAGEPLLSDVSFTVHRGDRIGVVGLNGCGKTTLLQIMAGRLHPQQGEVSVARGVRVAYVGPEREPPRGDLPLGEYLLGPLEHLVEMERDLQRLAEELAHAPADRRAALLEAYGELASAYERHGGYELAARVAAVAEGMGLAHALERPMASLSAGEQARAALGRALLDQADILLLDEPTNHLDLPGRVWLERYLATTGRTCVIVSHDRAFLDACATRILHLDRGRVREYAGNYSAFEAQRAVERRTMWAEYEQQARAVRRLEAQARHYRQWAQAVEATKVGRGPVDRGYIGHKAARLMKRALAAERRLLEKAEEMKATKPFERDPVRIRPPEVVVRSDRVVVLDAVSLVVGERTLFEDLSLELEPGERLAILGPNGCGKTSLLRVILGEIAPSSGRVWLSPSARIGYFDQQHRQLDWDRPALAQLLEGGQDETLVRTVLGRLRVQRETPLRLVGRLSSGERAKVLLARLLLGGCNVMVLDEPTNHLDIETQDVLIEALAAYTGTVIFVTHDRHLVRALATRTLELAGSVGRPNEATR